MPTHDHLWDAEQWCTCGLSRSDTQWLSPLNRPGNHKGRPKGSVNYSGLSLVSKRLKMRGIDWLEELASEYTRYKTLRDRSDNMPVDRTLIDYWIAVLPYLTLTLNEKASRGALAARMYPRKHVSANSLSVLEKMENRDDAPK